MKKLLLGIFSVVHCLGGGVLSAAEDVSSTQSDDRCNLPLSYRNLTIVPSGLEQEAKVEAEMREYAEGSEKLILPISPVGKRVHVRNPSSSELYHHRQLHTLGDLLQKHVSDKDAQAVCMLCDAGKDAEGDALLRSLYEVARKESAGKIKAYDKFNYTDAQCYRAFEWSMLRRVLAVPAEGH